MVQVFKTDNPQGRIADMLGMSLGQGIGNGLNTYFANRSLDSVLHDKALEGAPQSKKFEALRAALSPYGEKGQEIFQQRMMIDQMEMQEAATKKQEASQKIKGKALGRYLKGETLTPEEEEMFTPQEFVAMYKAKNPKPVGGALHQPIPIDQMQLMEQVIQKNPDASADQLTLEMGKAGVNPDYSNPYIENRRRAQETGSKQDLDLHKESEKFEETIRNHATAAKKQIPLIESGIKSVKEGKIKPSSLANVFTYFGETGKKISNALLSKDESALLGSIPEFLEGRKELFGVRLSDADLKLLQDKLPDIGKNKEANLAILNLMKRAAERSIKLEEVAGDVLEKKGVPFRSGKLRPLGYEKEVMKAFDESMKNEGKFQDLPDPSRFKGKKIKDSQTGEILISNGVSWEKA